ncbi:MAG: prenyltransferase [bacterium]|nr:prenyltransferase [bacterium]
MEENGASKGASVVGQACIWLRGIRPHFLLLTVVSVAVGLAVALNRTRTVHWPHALLALTGGLLAHIAVNVLNDYHDHRSGLDFLTRPTPFSGGSGTLTGGLIAPRRFLVLGMTCVGLIVPVGLYFSWRLGPAVLLPGLAGILLVCSYTTRLTRHPLLCLIAPGLGFGPIMVLGVHYTQTGTWTASGLAASLVPGFLVSGLLLLNQFPDVEADAWAGRRHYVVVWGRRRAARIYATLLGGAYLALIAGVLWAWLPWPAGLGLATLPLAFPTVTAVLRLDDRPRDLLPLLKNNILLVLLTPLLAAAGMVLAHLAG